MWMLEIQVLVIPKVYNTFDNAGLNYYEKVELETKWETVASYQIEIDKWVYL